MRSTDRPRSRSALCRRGAGCSAARQDPRRLGADRHSPAARDVVLARDQLGHLAVPDHDRRLDRGIGRQVLAPPPWKSITNLRLSPSGGEPPAPTRVAAVCASSGLTGASIDQYSRYLKRHSEPASTGARGTQNATILSLTPPGSESRSGARGPGPILPRARPKGSGAGRRGRDPRIPRTRVRCIRPKPLGPCR